MKEPSLYSSLLSANGRKVEAIVQHLDLKIHIKNINIYAGEGQSPAYIAINSLGQIPSYEDADICLHESNVILLYLSQQSPEINLAGDTPAKQAIISSWLFWESSQWQPILSDVLAAHVGHILLPDMLPKPETTANWQHVKRQKQLTYLENTFAQQSFLVNNYLSIADFAVAAMTTYFIKTEFPFEQYPHFYRWYKTINALNAWQKTQHKLWQSQ